MSTDWRKLGLFLVVGGGLYIILVGIAADFTQVLSLKHGARLLVLLFVVALGYNGWEQGRKLWINYRTLRQKIHEVHEFILASMGKQSTTIFLCATARWLRRHGRTICVRGFQSENIVVLDMGQIPLESEDSLAGVWFSIIGVNGRQIGKGQVKLYTPDQACMELYELAEIPHVGDLAIPIEPPEATDLERLLGNILFIVSE